MQVYAALFKLRNGVYPQRAVLYFLNELDEDASGKPKYIVDLTEDKINTALEEFDHTAGLIQQYKLANTWNPPPPEKLSILEDTCTICDIRWSCPSYIGRMGDTQEPSISIVSDSKTKGRKSS